MSSIIGGSPATSPVLSVNFLQSFSETTGKLGTSVVNFFKNNAIAAGAAIAVIDTVATLILAKLGNVIAEKFSDKHKTAKNVFIVIYSGITAGAVFGINEGLSRLGLALNPILQVVFPILSALTSLLYLSASKTAGASAAGSASTAKPTEKKELGLKRKGHKPKETETPKPKEGSVSTSTPPGSPKLNGDKLPSPASPASPGLEQIKAKLAKNGLTDGAAQAAADKAAADKAAADKAAADAQAAAAKAAADAQAAAAKAAADAQAAAAKAAADAQSAADAAQAAAAQAAAAPAPAAAAAAQPAQPAPAGAVPAKTDLDRPLVE